MAARQYISDYNLCGSFGERRGNTLEDLLRKYYSLSYEDFRFEEFSISLSSFSN